MQLIKDCLSWAFILLRPSLVSFLFHSHCSQFFPSSPSSISMSFFLYIKKKKNYLLVDVCSYVYVHVCTNVHTCQSAPLKVRSGVNSFPHVGLQYPDHVGFQDLIHWAISLCRLLISTSLMANHGEKVYLLTVYASVLVSIQFSCSFVGWILWILYFFIFFILILCQKDSWDPGVRGSHC